MKVLDFDNIKSQLGIHSLEYTASSNYLKKLKY